VLPWQNLSLLLYDTKVARGFAVEAPIWIRVKCLIYEEKVVVNVILRFDVCNCHTMTRRKQVIFFLHKIAPLFTRGAGLGHNNLENSMPLMDMMYNKCEVSRITFC
jgi:hypothetical protein